MFLTFELINNIDEYACKIIEFINNDNKKQLYKTIDELLNYITLFNTIDSIETNIETFVSKIVSPDDILKSIYKLIYILYIK